MGPVESAIRAATKPGTTLTTLGQSKPFVVEEFTPDAMVILLGSGQHRTRISWGALEGVIDFLRDKGWVRAGGQFSVEGEPGTLDAFLKQWLKRDVARWVVRVLDVAALVEVDPALPLRLRLRRAAAAEEAATDSEEYEARDRLARVLRDLAVERRDRLETLKQAEQKNLKRDDWLWHALLQASSSWGNSRGWEGLIHTPANYDRVTWAALERHGPVDRERVLEAVLRAAKVRMPKKKAGFLARNFSAIEELGGPAAAKEQLLGQEGRQGKIKFLERFAGVGPKYARNTMMDLYHEEFRDSVAVDARIQGVSIVLGVEFANYDDHEDFYCSVAREAGLEAWEVDRLLYWFNGEVLSRLDRPESGAMQQLLKRIAELEERVAELEALEVRVSRLEG